MDLRNVSVLITGAASGMGAATADHFEQLGARVARLDNAFSDSSSTNYPCDVTDSAAPRSLAAARRVNGVKA